MAFSAVHCVAVQKRGGEGRGLVVNEDYRRDLIEYRLKRARGALKEALLMEREEHWNTCANRLYYACFYAVTPLLGKQELVSSKHS